MTSNGEPHRLADDLDPAALRPIRDELAALCAGARESEAAFADWIAGAHPAHAASARNLVHYLALRRHDIRPLQERLAAIGLSSLGRAEGAVLAGLGAVRRVLGRLVPDTDAGPEPPPPCGPAEARALLAEHARALLGDAPPRRAGRIMVTMPGEAADDYELVRDLLDAGMDCMRVNCAHDGPDAWGRMIDHLRRAEAELGRPCRVLMDLAGPKLRTGPMADGPRVLKWRPARDDFGRVTAPARVWLTAAETPAPPPADADAALPVPADWLGRLRAGDRVKFRDARDARRRLVVTEAAGGGRWAECDETAYVATGTRLRARRAGVAEVGPLPPKPLAIRLKPGDTLVLTRDPWPGRPAQTGADGRVLAPAMIACTLPEVFDHLRPGQPVWFDDGRIGGVVLEADGRQARVEITHARPGGERLAGDKGINLPETDLRLPPLTEKDRHDLAFVAARADLVGYSFVRTPSDVRALQSRLGELGGADLGIVLKIETRQSFEQLPMLLLAALHSRRVGVMIARGDLAVECGFERLAEVQEEILWVSEAAHAPVIWATQVLETLAKEGKPSRAEITDAAMGERAECVMLNKGPHVRAAIRTLDDILRRMGEHQRKKRSMLRPLRLARRLPAGAAP
jgi:pyruvate kinase